MNKKGLSAFIIILAVLAIMVIGAVVYTQIGNVTSDGGFIKVRLYDAYGNPITNALSVVNNGEGVSYIDLTITATSTGSIPLSCDLVTTDTTVNGQIPPNVFSNALVTGAKTLSGVGSKVEWTTNLIAVSSLEGAPSPDVFATKVRCQYSDAEGVHYIDQSGSIPITIVGEGSTGFTVDVGSGGLPSSWCGNSVCDNGTSGTPNIGETATSCPSDCSGTVQDVNFRTSDLSYPFGSAIAYNKGTCGSLLTQFGYDTTTCWTITDATCPTVAGYSRVLSTKTIPGKPIWSTNTACLYNITTDATQMAVAWKATNTNGPCGTVGQWGVIKFNTASTYKTKASTVGTLVNTQRDLICP